MQNHIGALTAAALLLLAACGDSGDVNLSGDLEVTGVEFEFLPDAYVINEGDIEIVFSNAGSIIHEWVVLSDEIADESEFSEDLVLFRVEAPAGQTARATLTIGPGSYQVVCAIEGHLNAGMKGTLEVLDN